MRTMYLMNTHPVVVQQVVTRVTPIQRTVMSHRQRQQSYYDAKNEVKPEEKKVEKTSKKVNKTLDFTKKM